MRSPSPWSVLSLFLLACDEPAPGACVELADGPVQLIKTDNPRFHIDLAGGHTFISSIGDWVDDFDHVLHVGEACGADARLIGRGLMMVPVRLHPDDPDAEDPSLVCSESDSEFFRIDLDGLRPSQLVLPRLACYSLLATPHGPVIGERHRNVLWHFPKFPAEEGAVMISTETYRTGHAWVGGRLLYTAPDGIHRRDLASGDDELLVIGGTKFLHTDTHLLWRGKFDGDAAPVHVRDLATDEDHHIGFYRPAEDESGPFDPGPGWRFDADGRHILHLPNVPDSLMSAFDLTGAPVAFAGAGVRLAYPPSGGVVVQDGPVFRHAFAGSATGTTLDVPDGAILDDLQTFDDRLELRVGDDLYAVPLDGSPALVLAHDVAAVRTRVDAHLLFSLADNVLVLIHQPTGDRTVLANQVDRFSYHPGHGVYYSRRAASGAPINGVWMIADDRLHAEFTDCGGTCP